MSMYLDVTGIEGESKSPVASWNKKVENYQLSYTVNQTTSLQAGSGLITSGASFSPMSITKVMDKSTPLLWAKLCGGEPIDLVIIRVSRPGANPLGPAGGLFEAENYVMQNVLVTSYSTSGVPGPGGLPSEDWTLAFTAITENYRTVDAKGNLQPPQSQGWDIGANAPAIGAPAMGAGVA